MLLLATVMSSELPLSNVLLLTVADDQPDSNWPAAWPEDASSTPWCLSEVMLPLLPFTVNTSPEPVSKLYVVAAPASVTEVRTPAAASAATAAPATSADRRRMDAVMAGLSGYTQDIDEIRCMLTLEASAYPTARRCPGG